MASDTLTALFQFIINQDINAALNILQLIELALSISEYMERRNNKSNRKKVK
jgi:hypothetical protein